MFGPPLPTFFEPLISLTVLAPAIGSVASTDAPSGGGVSGSNSAALWALNRNAEAASCVAAAFRAAASPPDRSGSAAPLTVARLFRSTLVFFATFDREDFAIASVAMNEKDAALSAGPREPLVS